MFDFNVLLRAWSYEDIADFNWLVITENAYQQFVMNLQKA
jgi:hypothetical protein